MCNYSEQIFQSIDTIITQRLNEVSFDKTEICKIVKVDKQEPGKYLVSNEGGLKYEAYSIDENKEYLANQKVYVTIPQGKYEFRKLIIGSYSEDELKSTLYTLPFKNFVISNKYIWLNEHETLSAAALKTEDDIQQSSITKPLNFYNSGFGTFDYCGIEFSATTGFGGATGEFQILIDFLNEKDESLNILPFSSKQLYGNPYYLDNNLKFQHLFTFPKIDVTQIKKIQISLVTKGGFDYSGYIQNVIINQLTLFFGFDNKNENIISNTSIITLLEPVGDNSMSYTNSNDKKLINLEWYQDYNKEVNNYLLPYDQEQEYNIYWLQYSESIGYKKFLETIKPDILSCYANNLDDYKNKLNNKFKNDNEEALELYDNDLFNQYVALYSENEIDFQTNVENKFIDIQESGVYWKTVKKENASKTEAYQYELFPSEDWKKEQIKVIIKSAQDEIIETNGLVFENTNFKTEIGSNLGTQDNLRLTLNEGNDGIYNNYGLDNKLISTKNKNGSITVDYIDTTNWNNVLQDVVWKIPKQASMIARPQIYDSNKKTFVDDPAWDMESNEHYYLYKNDSGNSQKDAKLISFQISDQFSFSKTNNTIICEITRYKTIKKEIIDNKYHGSITLQFGTQGTSGSSYAFNIYPNRTGGLQLNNERDFLTFIAKLEDSQGNQIDLSKSENIQWYYLYGDREIITDLNNIPKGNSYTVNLYKLLQAKEKISSLIEQAEYNLILVAELTNWEDSNGNIINLKAYYPISHTKNLKYYMAGASKIVYNYQGTSPSYDETPYTLYNENNEKINNIEWELLFDIDNIGTNNQSIQLVNLPETNEVVLQVQNSIESNVKPYSIVAKNSDTKEILWIQPIFITRNAYAFDLINKWDNKFSLNEEEGYILAELIGAGKKDSDNKYTGVLMGTVGDYGLGKTGLYGFKSGTLRYKLDEEGTFYVGTGSDNCIDFSSDNLKINVENFTLNTDNLTIDSINKYISISSQEELRIKLGLLKPENNLYGLDIYEGAFRLYGKSYNNKLNEETDATLSFRKKNDFDTFYTMYLNGMIERTAERNEEFDYNTDWGTSSHSFTNITKTIIGDQDISINIDSNGILRETWLSGITLANQYSVQNTDNFKNSTTYFGIPEGRAYAYYNKDWKLGPPLLLLTIGSANMDQIIGTISSINNGDTWNKTILASSRQPSLRLNPTTGAPVNQNDAASLVVFSYKYDNVIETGVRIYGTVFTNETGSDLRIKKNIETLSEKYNMFFDCLKPRRYQYIDGTSSRYHTGYIAQDVNEALEKSNLTTQEFAGLMLTFPGTEQECYHLRKEEFVALNTWQIQMLKARMTELEKEIKEIKNEIQ